MTQTATIEREVKLSVWQGYALPDLSKLLDGASVTRGEEQELDAIYYDTADLRLLRRGVTVRFRHGEPPGDVWTVKLPAGAPAIGLARCEITMSGQAGNVPEAVSDLVRGWATGAPLTPVARLRTVRRRTTLQGPDGHPLALLDDDEVSVLRGERVAARFRELEVELACAEVPAALLGRVAQRLEATGAQPVDQVPKLVRVLGPPALVPWELAAPELPVRPTAADLVRAGLRAAAARFIDHQAAVVLDEDPEGVHQARVGIRRIRSDLRSFGPLLELENVRTFREELAWLSDELGAVRDLDVLLASLRADVQQLDREDRAGVDEAIGRLGRERATAHARLISAMRSPRFQALLGRLAEVVVAPPFAPGATQPAADLMPALVRRSLRQLRHEVDRLGTNPEDAELHRVRILAKRLRYATDVSVPVAGKAARRAAGALGRLQDLLGEHNDACMAVARLRELSVTTTPASRWSTGLLGGLALARVAARRGEFPAVYAAALAGRNWAWAQ